MTTSSRALEDVVKVIICPPRRDVRATEFCLLEEAHCCCTPPSRPRRLCIHTHRHVDPLVVNSKWEHRPQRTSATVDMDAPGAGGTPIQRKPQGRSRRTDPRSTEAPLPCTRLSLDGEIDCCPMAESGCYSDRLASLLKDVGQPSLSAIGADCATGVRS